MSPFVSIIIPAWNEEQRIVRTLQALQGLHKEAVPWRRMEIIVVDDGSEDRTYERAWPWVDALIKHPRRQGKGIALTSGIRRAQGDYLLFLDADLEQSAAYATLLVKPVIEESADMVIANLPAPSRPAGRGLVKGLARRGIYTCCGYQASAPLSGQRALKAEIVDRIQRLSAGFGIEVGLTIDVARLGYRIEEVDVPFQHRESGRDLAGIYHRSKQFLSVGMTLISKWREGKQQWSSDGSST
ncbi:Glucosyl-3-phosphoglycerate synthase [compost metagenome]